MLARLMMESSGVFVDGDQFRVLVGGRWRRSVGAADLAGGFRRPAAISVSRAGTVHRSRVRDSDDGDAFGFVAGGGNGAAKFKGVAIGRTPEPGTVFAAAFGFFIGDL